MRKFTFNPFLVCCLALALLPITTIGQQNLDLIEQLKVLGAERPLEKSANSRLILGLEQVYNPGGLEKLYDRLIASEGKILISAIPTDSPEKLKADLEAMGATKVKIALNSVLAWVSADQLPQLENVESLICAMPEYKPTQKVGLTTSQGDAAMRTDLIREFQGLDGTGVTIGILSDSYNTLGGAEESVVNGDLPGPGNPNGYTEPVEVLSEPFFGPGIDEGRAMAELVHDVAPGAKLKVRSAVNGFTDFAIGIQELAAAGCDIIVDDIGYFPAPYFQDGFISQSVTAVTQAGVAYFSAAGNDDRLSYEAPFNPSGIVIPGFGEFHNFGGGDIAQRITLPPGGYIEYWFQWDDNSKVFASPLGPAPEADIDLFLIDPNTGGIIAESIIDNPGEGIPIEIVAYFNDSPDPLELDLLIASFSGPTNRRIKYINFGSNILPDEYNTFSGTCFGHPRAAGGFGIGASAYFGTNEFGQPISIINNFSSAGGVPILLDPQGNRLPAPVVREQPYLTGPDGTNTTFFGFDFDGDGFPNFFGTSAAAPHVAAAAALLKQKNPRLTPEEIGLALRNTAEDMDDQLTAGFDEGYDFNTGYGMVQADAALASIADDPCIYRFEVYATKTGEKIQTLRDGDVIDLVDVPQGLINIVALVEGGDGKDIPGVKFSLAGKIHRGFLDKEAPYALFGDRKGVLKDWNVHVGEYKMKVRIPKSKQKAVALSFSVINSVEVESFLLVDAKTDQIIGELGDEINLSTLPSDRFNILAKLNDDRGNSRAVRFELSGTKSLFNFDHLAPYALFKDNNGDFYHWRNPKPGKYTLKATPFGNWNRNSIGTMLTKEFAIIKGKAKTDANTLRFATEEIEEESSLGFQVFPNPSADLVNFEYNGSEEDDKIKLEIFNMMGQRIFKEKMKGSLALEIDFQRFGPGLYIAKLTDKKSVKTQQIAIH